MFAHFFGGILAQTKENRSERHLPSTSPLRFRQFLTTPNGDVKLFFPTRAQMAFGAAVTSVTRLRVIPAIGLLTDSVSFPCAVSEMVAVWGPDIYEII